MSTGLHILYVGELWEGGTSKMRFNAMYGLCDKVAGIDISPLQPPKGLKRLASRVAYRLGFPIDHAAANRKILDENIESYDIIWIDAPRFISAGTLINVRSKHPDSFLVSFIMDDPFPVQGARWRRFLRAVPYYDLYFVARDKNIPELRKMGAKHVYRFYKGFDPKVHRPLTLSLGAQSYDVFFAGRWEQKREADIALLLRKGVSVTIAGGSDWKRKGRFWKLIKQSFINGGVYGQDYTMALASSKIALCFYSNWNRDKGNSRMYEVPACETFMLAERNNENINMFQEGKEAEFFSSQEELLQKVRYYLTHSEQRQYIAVAGRERCLKSGYSYRERLKGMLQIVCESKEK